MRWLVLGGTGQLGHELVRLLPAGATDAPGPHVVDLTDPASVSSLSQAPVDIVINAAAWTAVDEAESHPDGADAINHLGAGLVAQALAANPRLPVLLHVSTDYVFGRAPLARVPWPEDAPPEPLSVYGVTKWRGECAVRDALPDRSAIVRTAWLYGEHGSNFVRTMLDAAAEERPVAVVGDQWGQPTWAADLAERLVALGPLLHRGAADPATYHGTNSGATTWFDLARSVYSLAGADPALVSQTTTSEFPRPAPRPTWSVLGHDGWSRAGLPPMRPWHEALAAALPAIMAARG